MWVRKIHSKQISPFGGLQMKKKLVLILSLLLALFLATAAFAQGPTSYTSGFQVQNLSDTNPASILITYYKQDGTVDATTNDTIAAGTSTTYFGANMEASPGFNGSVVISSDQPVAAIVNLLGDGGAFGGASYGSFDSGSSKANVPLVLNNYFGISTFFNVQNTGNAPVTVNVTYVGTGGCSEPVRTVQPGAAITYDQRTSCVPNGFIGAANVDAGAGAVAVAVVQVNFQSLLAYNAFTTDGSSMAVAPLVSHNYFASRTALQIQNTGAASTSVTVNYAPSAGFPGSACSETQTIAAGASANFGDDPFFLNPANGCNAGSGWVGSAQISASAGGTVVAIVNSVTSGTPNAAAYSAFDPNTGTTTVNFPLVMDRNFGIFSGFSVANVGNAPANIMCTFSGTTYTASQNNVAVGASLTDVQLDKIAPGYVGSATCTANQPIVGVLSQLGGQGDKLLYYEGFNN
jgi:hypothetical protein